MPNTEICRIVSGYDTKQQANQWWEARLITLEGEKVIKRIDFWDETHRSDAQYIWAPRNFLELLSPFGNRSKQQEEMNRAAEIVNGAHARLIAQLMQEGWELAGTNMMKRVTP